MEREAWGEGAAGPGPPGPIFTLREAHRSPPSVYLSGANNAAPCAGSRQAKRPHVSPFRPNNPIVE
jgi:hypothetical protein